MDLWDKLCLLSFNDIISSMLSTGGQNVTWQHHGSNNASAQTSLEPAAEPGLLAPLVSTGTGSTGPTGHTGPTGSGSTGPQVQWKVQDYWTSRTDRWWWWWGLQLLWGASICCEPCGRRRHGYPLPLEEITGSAWTLKMLKGDACQ